MGEWIYDWKQEGAKSDCAKKKIDWVDDSLNKTGWGVDWKIGVDVGKVYREQIDGGKDRWID